MKNKTHTHTHTTQYTNKLIHQYTSIMQRLSLILIIIALASCTTSNQDNTSLEQFPVEAQWIGDAAEQALTDSLMYLDDPAPLFRKDFKTGEKVSSAKLYISAAGYYRATINGDRIGDHLLDPAWTHYGKRIYFSEYDISSEIIEGENSLGVTLGNGFYNPLPMKMWGGRNIRDELTTGRPIFIAALVLEYENGENEMIVSDNSWNYEYGPMLRNSVYLGEVYDANREIEGWNMPEYQDNNWQKALVKQSPGGKLQKLFFPPIQLTEEISPVEIYQQEEGLFIVDMGVNFTGSYKIKLKGNKGDTVSFRFGERVYEDGAINPMTTVCGQIKRAGVGGPGAPAIAWQIDKYIFGENGEAYYSPEFTFHTYRYMEISGLDKKPLTSDITGHFLHTNVPKNGEFSTSSDLLNSVQTAVERTFMANLISVQSDCPAREKFGYGGDLNATNEAFIYNYDMSGIYRKTVYDWVDAIRDSTFVDTAPFVGIKYCGLSWESAYLITQYFLYLYYGDIELVEELYDFNNKWMEKVAMIHPDGIVDKGLSDHESMKPVPVKLTGTSHYMQCAEIMREFSLVMKNEENAQKYGDLADRLRANVKGMYWDKTIEEKINRQTLFSTLLYHGIVPEKDIPAATDSLIKAVQNGPSGHFNTGIFGTKYVLETLSKHASVQTVFDIVNSTEYPGWGFMIDNGATTIWETWKESDNTFSNCHPMFGMVTEWYYRWIGGIRPQADYPGFEEFILAPNTPDGLEFANCSYKTPHGEIISNWKKDGNSIVFEITVPKGTIAHVELPVKENMTILKDGKEIDSGEMKLKGGEYVLKVTGDE